MSHEGVPGPTESRWLTTNDGVRLHYLEAGKGRPVVFLPGWAQTASVWQRQIDAFSPHHRCIALDHRGHGRSAEPTYGYRLARLAADLQDLVSTLQLDDLILVAHSMGCAVSWAYWELFGGSRIRALVLVDQPPALISETAGSPELASRMGCAFKSADITALIAGLCGSEGIAAQREVLSSMFSAQLAADEIDEIIGRSLAAPSRLHAALLMLDQAYTNWDDVIARISVPTLVFGGELSMFPPAAARWISERIPGSTLRIFSAAERGSHFLFWENPTSFNVALAEFMQGVGAAQ